MAFSMVDKSDAAYVLLVLVRTSVYRDICSNIRCSMQLDILDMRLPMERTHLSVQLLDL